MKQIEERIKEYQTIIIHRHTNPDLDALGSQIGLAKLLKENFPEKQIYQVGEMNHFDFLGGMDVVEDHQYQDALVLILDVAVSHMVSDDRYQLAKHVMVIDHHKNASDLGAEEYIDSSYGACAELIADFAIQMSWKFTPEAATALFAGIVTDTGRFQYANATARTLRIASQLMEYGANPQFIYDNLYIETLESKRTKAYFAHAFSLTRNNVAYLKNDASIYEKFPLSPFSISRGMVNQMAGIAEVRIWANFTYDPKTEKIMCEFRSRHIPIVEIAKKYGGGGHECACGATIDSFEVADKILEDFDLLLDEVK